MLIITHFALATPENIRMSKKAEQPSKTHRNSKSDRPRPPLTLAKRGIWLHPTEKWTVSLTVFGSESILSGVKTFLAASMISGGARENVSANSTVSNV